MPKTACLGILASLLLWSGIPNSATWQWTWLGGSLWAGVLVLLAGIGILWGPRLGQGLDQALGLGWLGLGIPVLTSRWPMQGLWCWWLVGLHGLAVYGVMAVARDEGQRRWLGRGLGIWAGLWSGISLGLWLGGWGQFLGQNAQPLGHPNYVAGYGLLLLPVVVMLAWQERFWGWWPVAAGLGGVILTTQSRGGGLGLGLIAGTLLLQGLWRSRQHWLWAILGAAGSLALALANPRWQALGAGSPYRRVVWTAIQGILQDHLWLGTGPGTSAWIYPRYRPAWAGGEAVAVWQLHTTPGQVLVEVGLWGTGIVLVLGWLAWRWGRGRTWDGWLQALFYGLLGYSGLLLTDYQLDVAAISGLLVLLIGITLAPQAANPWPRAWRLLTLTLLALSLLLHLPRYSAWQISAQAPPNQLIPALRQAHQRFPTDPLYPLTLGWLTRDPQWFHQAQALAPYDEYLSTQLGWLDPAQAIPQFQHSYDLLPSRLGIPSALGLAKLAQGENGIPYLVRDILRHPHLAASNWYAQSLTAEHLLTLHTSILKAYQELLPRFPHYPFLTTQAAILAWWFRDPEGQQRWSHPWVDLLRIADSGDRPRLIQALVQQPVNRNTLLLMAWADADQRQTWLNALGDPQLAELAATTLAGDPDFRAWLGHPLWQQQYVASRGYLVLGTYRRADMPIVTDLVGIPVHRLWQQEWGEFLDVPPFVPDWDQALATLAAAPTRNPP
ncbi:MAG: hypothetical protein Q6L49_10580 [Thermostichales cyanobacterium HHBFW_bins_127]